MKPIFKSAAIASAGILVGTLGTLAFVKTSSSPHLKGAADLAYSDILKQHEDLRSRFDDIFNDEIFGRTDPFERLKKMRRQLEDGMEKPRTGEPSKSNPFDPWFSDKFGGGSVFDVSQREDEKFVYYDIKVEDLKSTSINTKVENGYVIITGTLEKKNDDEGSAVFTSSFNRTFPLPDHVDADKMEMLPENDKIVLKFPKTS